MTWRTAGHRVGLLVKVGAKDNSRVGHCWMRGRLLDGDLAMCVAHAGDCFWRYQLVEHGFTIGCTGRKGYKLLDGAKFGAYVLGEPLEWQPTEREMHLLLAGEMVSLDAEPSGEDVRESFGRDVVG